MPSQKISQMGEASTLTGAEIIPLVQDGVNVQCTLSELAAWVLANCEACSEKVDITHVMSMLKAVMPKKKSTKVKTRTLWMRRPTVEPLSSSSSMGSSSVMSSSSSMSMMSSSSTSSMMSSSSGMSSMASSSSSSVPMIDLRQVSGNAYTGMSNANINWPSTTLNGSTLVVAVQVPVSSIVMTPVGWTFISADAVGFSNTMFTMFQANAAPQNNQGFMIIPTSQSCVQGIEISNPSGTMYDEWVTSTGLSLSLSTGLSSTLLYANEVCVAFIGEEQSETTGPYNNGYTNQGDQSSMPTSLLSMGTNVVSSVAPQQTKTDVAIPCNYTAVLLTFY